MRKYSGFAYSPATAKLAALVDMMETAIAQTKLKKQKTKTGVSFPRRL